jgi:hypothetical protein
MFKRYGILISASFLFLSPINTNQSRMITVSSQTTITREDDGVVNEVTVISREVILEAPAAPKTKDMQELDSQEDDQELDDEESFDDGDDEGEGFFEPEGTAPVLEKIASQVIEAVQEESVQKAEEKTEEKAAPQSRTISVFIDISPEEQKYKHWTGLSYKPEEFYCTVNGVKIEPRSTAAPVPATSNSLTIVYYSRFENGRESSKKYIYTVSPAIEQLKVQFDWKRKVRIFLDDEAAAFESMEELI